MCVCLDVSASPHRVQNKVSHALKLDLLATWCECLYKLNLWAMFPTLKDLNFILCIWAFAYMYICAPHMCLVLSEDRRRHWIHWSYSPRCWWESACVLGTKPGSSTRVASALNRWSISHWSITPEFLTLLSIQWQKRCRDLILCLKTQMLSHRKARVLFLAIKNGSLEWIPALKGLYTSHCNIIAMLSLPAFLYLSYCRERN